MRKGYYCKKEKSAIRKNERANHQRSKGTCNDARENYEIEQSAD
jgi:hypothetical protein